ncbi:translation elongation factor Ts [bacterium]|jgi:elongation factor Ts|nr:translation elongation factor Ts [bacterium]MBT4122106.1 translation elongation factor Ts [bacterium]MBT4335384.1 translation elongation factor Ts [bacterium]MBT4495503.1 translation elongation factor Ts [bacterium]MBT4764315.1 translation elongation factor Ts [bacterium]
MSIELIKKIRVETGAGMGDIKDALDKAEGNEEKAIEILRKSGQQMAAKRAERSTSEGIISIKEEAGKIAVVALACETDFVARNDDFKKASADFADKLFELGKDKFNEWADQEIKNNLIVKIGENINVSSFDIIEGEVMASYLHSNKKVASVVVLEGGDIAKAKEVAMQVVAMNPKYIKPEDVPQEETDKEKEIYKEQLKKENKPDEIIEKILEGKVNKYYSEVCLIKQPYIKEDKMSIEKYLDGATVKHFSHFSL